MTKLVSPTRIYGETDSDERPYEIDKITRAMPVVDYSHHEIHEGDHFFVKGFFDLNTSTFDFMFVTPNTITYSHSIWEVAAEGEMNFLLYENASVSANGTPIPSFNNNRNSNNIALTLAYELPTVITTGALVWSGVVGSAKASGGIARSDNEFIGRINTKYLF